MITEAKLAANRANAQKSTGPRTEKGKTSSSRNSFKHGLYSKQLVVGAEEAAELDALKAKLRAEHQPANQSEEILVNELAEQFWRLRRARIYEASLLDSGETLIPHFTAIQRMMSSAERGFHKALDTLRQLQKARGFVPQSKQNRDLACQGTPALAAEETAELSADSGFVPQNLIDDLDWRREPAFQHYA